MNKYAYTDDRDKSYGISGVVISLNVLEQDGMLRQVSLDDSEGDHVKFTPDFYFCSNPRYSAKITWNETLKQYQLYVGMILGNIMSRYMVQRNTRLTQEIVNDIHQLIANEGMETCSLENDEIDTIFNKTYRYMSEVFDNGKVHYIIDNLVAHLLERRTLSGNEVYDILSYLSK